MDDSIPQSPYETLGVSQDADIPDTEKPFRNYQDELLIEQHTEQFQQIEEPYEFRSKESRKSGYDKAVKLTQQSVKEIYATSIRRLTQEMNAKLIKRLTPQGKAPDCPTGYASYQPRKQHFSGTQYILQQKSYTIYSDEVRVYPVQSYDAGHQLDQQSSSYYNNNKRNPNTELVQTAPTYSSKHKKERRPSSPSSPYKYPCLYPKCGHISSRIYNIKRHMQVHFPPGVDKLLDCRYEWCGRTGAHGFKREDHREEHYRRVHMKENEYLRTGKGERNGRKSSTKAYSGTVKAFRSSKRQHGECSPNRPSRHISTSEVSTTDSRVLSTDIDTAMKAKAAYKTVTNASVPSSGNPQPSDLLTKPEAGFEIQQSPKVHELQPDQEIVVSKASDTTPKTLTADASKIACLFREDWSTAYTDVAVDFRDVSDVGKSSSCIDDEDMQYGGKLGSTRRFDLANILRGRSSEFPLTLRELFESLHRRGSQAVLVGTKYIIDNGYRRDIEYALITRETLRQKL